MKKGTVVLALALMIPAVLIAPAPANADASDQLKTLLVDLPGWQGADREGWDMGDPGSRIVSAMRQYADADRTLDVKVVAGAMAQGGWDPTLKEGFTMDNSEALMEVRRVDGFLVLTSYEKASRSGTIIVFINDPSVSPGLAALLTANFEGLGATDALGAARKLDWKAMKRIAAALK
jgi:hypothetical protein